MKYFLLLSLLTVNAYAAYKGQAYLPDENHLPGHRSPALQKQAQEEQPSEVRKTKQSKVRIHENDGSKMGANPEAIDNDVRKTGY